MLDSMFALLTVSAVVLLVPAFAALLVVERHRHVSPGEDTRRRVRLVVAAVTVALAALGVTAMLGADAVSALVVAVVLAGSVLVWAPLTRSWAVRGVVLWALLVAGVLAVLGWLVEQMATGAMSGTEMAVTAGVTLLLLLSLWRGHGYAREGISAQAGLGPRGADRQGMPMLRPLISLALLVAAGGAVRAATSSEKSAPNQGHPPQAGRSATPLVPSPPQPSTAATPTIFRSPSGAGTPNAAPSHAADGSGGAPATWAGGPPELGVSQDTTGLRAGAPRTWEAEGPAVRNPAATPHAVPGSHRRRPAPGPVPTHHATPTTGAPSVPRDDVDWPTPVPEQPSGDTTYPEPAHPTRLPGHAVTRPMPPQRPAPVPGPPAYVPGSPPYVPVGPPYGPAPRPDASGAPLKTPGYAKDKPNRPAGAPSPGHGRQNRRGHLPEQVATLNKHPWP